MKPHIKLKSSTSAVMDSSGGSPIYDVGYPNFPQTAHKGASWTDRAIKQWRPARGSADSDLEPDRGSLISRGRDIVRNNGVASGAVRTIADNVVGTGFRLVPRPNYLALGRNKEWADAWALDVAAQYWGWAETTACHAGDSMTIDQITTQVFTGQLVSGGAVVLPLWITDRGDGYSTKLQTVEIDRLCNRDYKADTNLKRGGITYGEFGNPLAYDIRTTHPGELYLNGAPYGGKWETVPRRTPFGRARVLHIFDPERSAQSHGKPLLSSVLPEFKNVDKYTNAELQAAVVNAMIAAVIQTPMDQENIVAMFQQDPDAYLRNREQAAVMLEPGAMLPLFPGDTLKEFIPGRPASAFGMFVENLYRVIGVACDLPYELLMKDFSKTNYSSARASMLEAWRSFLRRRDWLGTQFLDPVYDLWLEERVNAGTIEAPDFYANRAAWTRCKWLGPGRGWVDPTKEATAASMRMAFNLSTLEFECAEQGLDWREVLDQIAVERAYKEKLGLPLDMPAPGSTGPAPNSLEEETAATPSDARLPVAA